MFNQSRTVTIALSLALTVLYGYVVVLLFTEFQEPLGLETLSWSFIMLLPYALGALGNFFMLQRKPLTLVGAILWPWLYCVGLFIVVTALSLGMLFCIVIGLPILLPAASLGGVTVWFIQRNKKLAGIVVLLTLLSPVVASPVEAQFATPTSTTITHTFIDIDATTAVVWDNIKSVAPIVEGEHRPNWMHFFGFPRPIAATLSHEGVGGVRDATFERGLRFNETITEWEYHKLISFDIVETSEKLLPPPLDLIDGERFDVLNGTYTIEQLDSDTIRLHLTSEHFLGTRFNDYGAWWTDLVMQNLQNYILDVIKVRAELS